MRFTSIVKVPATRMLKYFRTWPSSGAAAHEGLLTAALVILIHNGDASACEGPKDP